MQAFRINLLVLAIASVGGLCASGQATAAASWYYDSKTLSGAQCQPSTGSQWADFIVNPDGIRNIHPTYARYISCTIPLDSDVAVVSTDTDNATESGSFNMQLYLDYSQATTTVTTTCTIFRRAPGTGAFSSATRSVTSAPGGLVEINMYADPFFNGLRALDGQMLSFNCRLPSKIKLYGVWWGETGRTDGYSYAP